MCFGIGRVLNHPTILFTINNHVPQLKLSVVTSFLEGNPQKKKIIKIILFLFFPRIISMYFSRQNRKKIFRRGLRLPENSVICGAECGE
jgi:hypothetical protein